MDVQSAQSPYTPAGGGPLPSMNPPVLGSQVPGTSGGLPALSGLSVTSNPMVDHLQAQGREGDTTLVHMNPDEVSGLQALALSQGTSMTINPVTGLPEAFKLGKLFKSLLPTLLGAGLMFIPGLNAVAAAGIVGAGTGIATGSLKKGLLAGLSAYGGASLARGLGAGVQAAKTVATNTAGAAGTGATSIAPAVSTPGVTTAGTNALPGFTSEIAGAPATSLGNLGASRGLSAVGQTLTSAAPTAAAPALTLTPPSAATGFFSNFANAARAGLPAGTPSMLVKGAPMLAGFGLMNSFSGAYGSRTPGGQIDNSYTGPYTAQERVASFAPDTESLLSSSKERRYFNVDMPEIYDMQGRIVQPGSSTEKGAIIYQPVFNKKAKKGQDQYTWTPFPYMTPQEQQQPLTFEEAMRSSGRGMFGMPLPQEQYSYGFAEGGEVHLAPGGFVVDARSVAEGGNGFTDRGQERLAALGGIPLKGPGDGVSDSIPARIGNQPARVAAGEVYMPPEAVKRIGKGNEKRGAQKLYAMMDRAHQATKRGQNRDILKGLA